VRDAYTRAGDLQQEKMGPFANALGGGMPGLPDMPGMGGLGAPGAASSGGLDLGSLGLPGTGERPDSE
jgi:nucleoid-associated protein EbfC